MQIKSIELRNFKCHKSLKLNFDRINIIIGNNGKGKSSILDALSYALYGVTADGATKKELINNDIKSTKEKAYVMIEFDNGYKIVRDLSTSIVLLNENNERIADRANDIERYLNLDKDLFMNLIYGMQGKLSDTFIKYNNNQKQFIDEVFNISQINEPILKAINDCKIRISSEYNTLISMQNNSINANNYILQTLNNLGCKNMDELSTKIKETEEQIQLFGNIEDIARLKQEQASINSRYQSAIEYKEQTERQISNYENQKPTFTNKIDQITAKLETSKAMIVEAVEQLQKGIRMQITENTTDKDISNRINELCNIETWYDNLIKIIEEIDDKNLTNTKKKALQIIEYIRKIDVVRQNYNNVMQNYLNKKYQKKFDENDLINTQNQLKQLDIQISNLNKQIEDKAQQIDLLKDQLTNINKQIGSSDDLDQNAISLYRSLINNLSSLKSYFNSLTEYQKQVSKIVFDEDRLKQLEGMKAKLSKMEEVFKHDGFAAYLRNAYLKNVCNMLNEMLLNFGFNNLLPVTVKDSGELIFNDIKIRSISGAQKSVVAVILRLIYLRIIMQSDSNLQILILDEPVSNMDVQRVELFRNFLSKLSETLGLQLIIVTHDLNVVPENSHMIQL